MTEPVKGDILAVSTIALNRDQAADAVAIVRLLRSKQPDMAMFLIGSYADDSDGLQALVGAMAAFTDSILTTVDSMATELNRTADTLVPGADAILGRAARAVVTFDADAKPEQDSTA